jgi:trk system potassium uptake protein TrkH
MNYRLVLKIQGMILCIEAAFMAAPLLIALLTHGPDAAGFEITVALCAVLGVFFYTRKTNGRKMQPRDGFAIVGLCWIVLSAFGALPYTISGSIPSYVDAFFETVSGFTTTGATILTEIEGLPRATLFWRAETQWMGGMGVLVLTLALLPKLGEGSINLMRAESPGPTVTKLVPKVGDTARILYGIYIGLTLAETICLLLAGMPLYEAVTHAFTTISTGGYSVRNASIAAYNSEVINWIIIIFMFLSGINFSLLYAMLLRRFGEVLHNEELRLYTGAAVFGTLFISLNLLLQRGIPFGSSFSEAAFQVVSIMTTTGYATADYNYWPTFSQSILLAVMFMGACAGSTAGGLKACRVVTLCKELRRELRKILHPREVHVVCADGQHIKEETVNSVKTFFFAYVLILLVGTLIVSWDDIGFSAAFTATLTALSNVGPGLALVGPTGNFSTLSDLSKIVLSFCMLLGRLEIMPLLVLLLPSIWKRKNV